jgi:hypothetical protein
LKPVRPRLDRAEQIGALLAVVLMAPRRSTVPIFPYAP